jgi:hypothetical protein
MATQIKPIMASNQKLVVKGSVFYTDKRRRIDLKKPIRDLFEHIYKPVSYTMEVCLCPNQTIRRASELVQSKVRPILLYFEEQDDEMS